MVEIVKKRKETRPKKERERENLRKEPYKGISNNEQYYNDNYSEIIKNGKIETVKKKPRKIF